MIVPIVEGHSEVESIPVLIRRYQQALGVYGMSIARPIRVRRYSVVRPGELEKAIELAQREYPGLRAILLVLDADDDCPKSLGSELLARARSAVAGDVYCAVVLPRSELEAWFLAAVTSLRGQRGISLDATPPPDPEEVRDAKGRLTQQMTARTYVEVDDQPAFAQLFDWDLAISRCRSYRKFDKEVRAILGLS